MRVCTWAGCEFAWVQRSSSVCMSGCYLYKSRAINKSASSTIDHRETGGSDKKEPWICVSCIISYCYRWGCVALVTTSVLCSRWPVPAGKKSHIFSLVISGLLFREFGSLNAGTWIVNIAFHWWFQNKNQTKTIQINTYYLILKVCIS